MTISHRRQIPAASIALVAALAFAVPTRTTQAMPAGDCGTRYVTCVDRASQLDGFWARSKAGIDCAVNYVQCIVLLNWN